MKESWIMFKCRNAEERDKISSLIQRNRRLEEAVHKKVLGGPLELTDSDIMIDSLLSNISTMNAVIRLLAEKTG